MGQVVTWDFNNWSSLYHGKHLQTREDKEKLMVFSCQVALWCRSWSTCGARAPSGGHQQRNINVPRSVSTSTGGVFRPARESQVYLKEISCVCNCLAPSPAPLLAVVSGQEGSLGHCLYLVSKSSIANYPSVGRLHCNIQAEISFSH